MFVMAGDGSSVWLPIARDYFVVARKLEELGFIFSKGQVIVTGVLNN